MKFWVDTFDIDGLRLDVAYRLDQRDMLLIGKYTRQSRNIMVVDKGHQMLAAVDAPLVRAERSAAGCCLLSGPQFHEEAPHLCTGT